MTITTTRQYIESIDACIYIDSDGTFTYQDMLGYKSFKTLRGLNNHIAKVAKMSNCKGVKVTA